MGGISVTGRWFVLALVAVSACAPIATSPSPSLAAIQGGWWRSCDDSAVEFLIKGDTYSGDFAGSYKITLTGNVLVFTEGLINGHSINVTHRPLSFEILLVNDKELVLRPMPGNYYIGDWRLLSCK